MTLDVGAAPIIAAIAVGPMAARKLRRAGWFTWLMGWAVGLASLFVRRRT